MPNCDGYQVLERLRADGRLHDLPVIVISALGEIDKLHAAASRAGLGLGDAEERIEGAEQAVAHQGGEVSEQQQRGGEERSYDQFHL